MNDELPNGADAPMHDAPTQAESLMDDPDFPTFPVQSRIVSEFHYRKSADYRKN